MEEPATKDLRAAPRGVVVDGLARTHSPVIATIVPAVRPVKSTVDLLPLIPLEDGDSSSGLRLGGTIGQGGMGLVRKATQLALDREVAAKTIRADRRTPETVRQLLQEAWITGRLEHPNIVPIYSLGQTEDGAPVIVMKRIEGTRWTMMMHNSAARPDDAGEGLEWNLQVLMQVCRAIEFAHQKGIIHRDLKPDNVMIGAFGEVYVLDWGLAVSLDDDGSGRLPHVSDAQQVVGTPSYMAPEMFGAQGRAIGPWTDVYLLGAILHKVLTGLPPHEGGLDACFQSANREEPRAYDSSVPWELAEVCRRAMHRDPQKRFRSVREFRESLGFFMEHMTSLDLSMEARVKLERIERVLAHDATLDEDHDQLLGEVIFGFEHALRIWPQNDEAEHGLQRALEHAFLQAITHHRLSAAEHWMSRMPHPSAWVERKLNEERAEYAKVQADAAQLDVHRRQNDLNIGSEARFRLVLVSAVVLSTLPWVDAFLGRLLSPSLGSAVLFVAPLLGAIIAAAAVVLARRAATEISARIAGAALIAAAMSAITRYLAYSQMIVTERLMLLDLMPLLVILAIFALFIDRRLRSSLGLAATVFAAALHAPTSELPAFFALAHLLSIGSIAWIWGRPSR